MTKATEASTDAAIAASANAEIARWALMDAEESSAFTLGQMEAQTAAQDKSARAAQGASITAAQTLESTKKQFQIEVRPYVVKTKVHLAEIPTINNKLLGEVCWQNTGRTPALEFSSVVHIDLLAQEPDNPTKWVEDALTRSESKGDIGSGIERCFPVRGDNPLSKYWEGQIESGGRVLYIWGAVIYKDVLGLSHYSTVCGAYERESVNPLYLWACNDTKKNAVK
jgi:hypothetical protein